MATWNPLELDGASRRDELDSAMALPSPVNVICTGGAGLRSLSPPSSPWLQAMMFIMMVSQSALGMPVAFGPSLRAATLRSHVHIAEL